jgi:hypothetical protein
MRFMMLMYPGPHAEAGVMPSQETIAKMMAYNEELAKAGVLVSLDGLQATSKGARVRFNNGKPSVTDGPFTESKEILGGYWMIKVKSREEALEWASKIPGSNEEMVEVRQVFEMEDFDIPAGSELSAQVDRVSQEVSKSGA